MPVPAVEEGGGLGVQRFRVVPPAEEGVKSPDGNCYSLKSELCVWVFIEFGWVRYEPSKIVLKKKNRSM